MSRFSAHCVTAVALYLLAAPSHATVVFSAEQLLAEMTRVSFVSAADLDGDGDIDLWVASEGRDVVSWVENVNGDATVWSFNDYFADRPRDVVIADLDGDDEPDLLTSARSSSEVIWWRNDLAASGDFIQSTLATLDTPDSLVAAPFDGDLDLDLIVSDRRGDEVHYIENAAGTWNVTTASAPHNGAHEVQFGDLDGDGDLDIAGGSGSGGGDFFWLENGLVGGSTCGGDWCTHHLATGRTKGVVMADIDRDGDLDLLREAGPQPREEITWWENLAGDASAWAEHGILYDIVASETPHLIDFDCDGDLDLFGVSTADWMENVDGTGGVWTRHSLSDAEEFFHSVIVDIDTDGDLDYVGSRVFADRIVWFENLNCTAGDPDSDADGVADGCDLCPGFDDSIDSDGDGVPDGCDTCAGEDDNQDTNNNGAPDACEILPLLSIRNATQIEGTGGARSLSFTVDLIGGDVSGGFTVPFTTADGTATAGSDYATAAGTLTFAGTDGEQQFIVVPLTTDDVVENDENLVVDLGLPSTPDVVMIDNQGDGLILDDDEILLETADVSIVEGDSGTSTLTFTVQATGESALGGFTADYATVDDRAEAGTDYVATSGTLTFTGSRDETFTIDVVINGDTVPEPHEPFVLQFDSFSVSWARGGRGVGTILNDDGANLYIDDYARNESNGGTAAFFFDIRVAGTPSGGFTVGYSTSAGTATTGVDFNAASGTATFVGTPDEVQTIQVDGIGEFLVELDETFFVDLGTPSLGGLPVSDGQALGTIINDDGTPLGINDVTLDEGDSGTTNFTFTAAFSGRAVDPVSVPFTVSDGTAIGGSDYALGSGTLIFAGGIFNESQTVTVAVNGDTTVESDETFFVDLGTPSISYVSVVDNQGLGTIVNDDFAGTLAISDASVTEGDSGTASLNFTVTFTGLTPAFTIGYSTANGTATAGADFTAASGTLSFTGTTGESQTVTIDAIGETLVELDETFFVDLGTPSDPDVTVSDGQGQGTILNDDAATIAIGDVSLSEGNAGTTNFTFTATLAGDVAGGVSVGYSTSDGTAAAGSDYTAATGTLTFAGIDGETQTATISVLGETLVEADETFFVDLGTPSNASVTVSDGQGQGTILNDDAATVAIDDVSLSEGDSGATSFTFTATLAGDVAGGFTVGYSTSDGTGVAAVDYTPTAGTLTFAGVDGETQTVTVDVLGETLVEPDETFFVDLAAPSNASVTLADGQGEGTILNDDAAAVAIDDVSLAEGDSGTTSFTFTATLTGDVVGGFTVGYSTSVGTATVGVDYASATGTLTFAGTTGETQTLTVDVVGETVAEPNETFFVDLGAPSNASVTLFDGQGLGTILNDDSATLSIDDVALAEGNAGTTNFVFTVTLSEAVAGGFTVDYSTSDGTATSAADYTTAAGTLTFVGTLGETQTLTVDGLGETLVEADETFFVDLGTPSNASVTLADGQGQGTIQNDDSATVSIDDVSLSEGDSGTTSFTFTATLTGDVAGGFTTVYSTTAGTATASVDYTPAAGVLTFAGVDGETQTVVVDVVGETIVEPNETFFVDLGTPSNASVTLADGQGLGTILNDDGASLSIDDVSISEGDSGTTSFVFTVTLSEAVVGGFTVGYSTSDVTATAGVDYTAAAGTLSFVGNLGETQTISIDVIGETVVEPDETFVVDLGTPSNASVTLADGQGQGTILNDDGASLSIDDVSLSEGDSGTTSFVFTATLTDAVAGGFTVAFATSDVTATAGVDYTAASGVLAFAGIAGETQTVAVDVLGDTLVELDEIYVVDLGAPSNTSVAVVDGQGQGTILNDDGATVAITDVALPEGNSGTTDFLFSIELSGDVAGGFTVDFATVDGTAIAPGDYAFASGTVSFAGVDGEVQDVLVDVVGDFLVEADETFTVTLDNFSSAAVIASDPEGLGVILNDDAGVEVPVLGSKSIFLLIALLGLAAVRRIRVLR